ncbi:MAG: glycosyltransferase family 25 protein [Rhodobacteraceae bacterium]|nr:glycosyltransferase family 25 protein [Paracoccaceae bacterium]
MAERNGNGGASLLDLFDRVYVINLPARTDRRAEMERQLARVGLSFDRPEVVLFEAVRPADKGEFPTIGTRGCYLSHLGVIEQALADGCETFLLMEDDADFTQDFNLRMPLIRDGLQGRHWDFLYGWSPGRHDARAPAGNAEIVSIAPDHAVKLAHFLGMRRGAAERALPYLQAIASRPYGDPAGGAMHVDGAYGWFRAAHPDLVTLASLYPVAAQRSSRTDIHDLDWYDRIAPLRPILEALRRLKYRLRRV